MNKTLVFAVTGIALLITGAVAYVLIVPSKTNESTTNTTTSTDAQPEASTPKNEVDGSGTYAEYSADAVLASSGTKLLFFHAPWCTQCRAMEASIKADGLPGGVTVFKVDYDSNQALRQKYGVTLQTTFVKIDDKGDKISSYVAYEEPQFSSVQRELLK